MTYEVQFQSGGTDYTVRAETIEDTLALIQRLQALTKPADDGWVEWNGKRHAEAFTSGQINERMKCNS